MGYCIPYVRPLPLSEEQATLPIPSRKEVFKGRPNPWWRRLQSVLAPSSPGFCSQLLIILKSCGAWHPIIDLSALNRCVLTTRFCIETSQSVLQSVQQYDWVFFVDLKDTHL